MNKAFAILAVCLLAAGVFGCTGAPAPNRSKDFPLTLLDSAFVPGILQATGIDLAANGNAFLVLKVRMENRGSGTASVTASGFKVVIDAESYGCDFLRDTDNDPRFLGQDFSTAGISPKSYVEGWTVFEVPASTRTVTSGELRFYDRALIGEGAFSKVDFAPSTAKRFDTTSERLTVEARSMTVSYKFTREDGSVATPTEEMLFAVCDLVVTNNARTKTHLPVKSDNIVFVSSQKTEYIRGAVDTSPDTDRPLKGQDIQPSGSAKGTVIFEVPEDDSYINKVVIRWSAQEVYSYAIPKARIDIEENGAPVARITANDTGFIDTDILFDANASSDPDTDALGWRWDFGNKATGSDTSTQERAFYKYPEPGSYIVTLKVTDIGGLENTATKTVRITHYFSMRETGHGVETDANTTHDGDFFVDVNLTNNCNRTRSVPYALFKLKASDGSFIDWAGDDGKHPSSIAPGAFAAWRVYFEVPKGKIPVSITFDDAVSALF